MSSLRLLAIGLLVTLAPLASGPAAGAEPSEKAWSRRDVARAGTEFVVLHQEARRWVVDTFFQADGYLQEREASKAFAKRAAADQYVCERIQAHPDLRAVAPGSAIGSERVFAPQTEVPAKVLWKTTEQWSAEWEDRYSAWVHSEFTKDFYVRNRIKTDCADAGVAVRWIFARMHGLPAANTLAGSDVLVTNSSMKRSWLALPTADDWTQDRRFRRALDYVLDNTYTHSFYRDSYPIDIRPGILRPGSYHLEIRETDGHTMIATNVDRDGTQPGPVIQVLYSDEPKIVRELYVSGYFRYSQPTDVTGGWVGYRWPVLEGSRWVLKPAAEMAGYSRMQWAPEFMAGHQTFGDAVLSRLITFDPARRMEETVSFIHGLIDRRRELVDQGYAYCSRHDCAPGSPSYDLYGTPAKDARLADMFAQGMALASNFDLYERWFAAGAEPALTLGGVAYRVDDVIDSWRDKRFSSDPRVTIAERWGLVQNR